MIKKNIFDIFVDFLIFIHFHYVKMHRLLSSRQRRNIFRQDRGIDNQGPTAPVNGNTHDSGQLSMKPECEGHHQGPKAWDLDDSSSEDPDATIPYCNHDDSSSEDPDATIPYCTEQPIANWVSQYTSKELRNLQLDDSDLCPIFQWIESAHEPSDSKSMLHSPATRSIWIFHLDVPSLY